jgi:hypothetical protein
MSMPGLILRWVAALLVAGITWIVVAGLGAVVWKKLQTDPVIAVQGTISLATLLAVLGGAFVVPRKQWKVAALTIWILFVVCFLFFVLRSMLSGRTWVADFEEFCSALIGGFFAYFSVRLAAFGGLSISRSVKTETVREKRTVTWWIKRLLLVLAILLCFCAMLFANPYDLYAAWKFHTVHVRIAISDFGIISYETHPIAFWCFLVLDSVLTALLIALVVYLVKQIRFERNFWRKRKTRPPTEDGIRQQSRSAKPNFSD